MQGTQQMHAVFIPQISPILHTAQICWKFFFIYFYYAYSVKAQSFIMKIPELRNVFSEYSANTNRFILRIWQRCQK
jgi:hypothetical protein